MNYKIPKDITLYEVSLIMNNWFQYLERPLEERIQSKREFVKNIKEVLKR